MPQTCLPSSRSSLAPTVCCATWQEKQETRSPPVPGEVLVFACSSLVWEMHAAGLVALHATGGAPSAWCLQLIEGLGMHGSTREQPRCHSSLAFQEAQSVDDRCITAASRQ